MTDWPRIQTDVDDDRPAREEEVEYCEACDQAFVRWSDELREHCGQDRCEDCRPYCALCGDWPVYYSGEFCEPCGWWAMGVEL